MFLHFRQTLNKGSGAQIGLMGHSRVPGNHLTGGDGFGHPRFAADHNPIPDGNMSGHPDLSGQDHPFPQDSTAGNSHLGDEQGIFADHYIMGHMDQIVGFDPGLDPGLAQGRPVDGIVGPDLTIIVNLDEPSLGDFNLPLIPSWAKPKPSLPITVPL